MTAMAISYLAEASAPYGIEAHSGRGLAAFLKAIGFVIPLMDPEDAKVYVMTVM
jgi:splicing factor 3B subunit 1